MTQSLAVAGGLICVYILFALIVAHVVEWINALLNTRGSTLYAGILEMLSAKRSAGFASALGEIGRGQPGATPVSALGEQIAKGIYAHPLVGNLGMKRKPSYIPARTFTLSLIASLRSIAGDDGIPRPPLDAVPEDLLVDLRRRVDALRTENPDDAFAKSLGLVVEQAQNRYESVLRAIDGWYNSQMDRITGTFRRYATMWQMAVAAIVVYLFNVDTFAILNQLSSSSTLQALATSTQHLDSATQKTVSDLLQPLLAAGIRIGWSGDPVCTPALKPWSCWGPHVPGYAITWFAVLLGAPFWFDVLKQIVPVRLTGTKPDATAALKGDKQAVS